jgi:hypothetical protein
MISVSNICSIAYRTARTETTPLKPNAQKFLDIADEIYCSKSEGRPCKGVPREVVPRGIDAITLFVSDLEGVRAFYQDVFGLPVFFEDDDSVVFDFGNIIINLLREESADELTGQGASCRRLDWLTVSTHPRRRRR